MENKKLDINSIIGFILIFGILMYMLWKNQPTAEELEAQKQEQIATEKTQSTSTQTSVTPPADPLDITTDSIQKSQIQHQLGAFAYSLNKASKQQTRVETDLFALTFSNKGGYLSELRLKKYVNYNKEPIYLIKNDNAGFNLNFKTTDNRVLNTENMYFKPAVSKNGDITIVSMKLKVSENKFLEYRYELKPNDYMMGFTIRSQGLNQVFDSTQDVDLSWHLKAYRHAKSISYENRYTDIRYEYEDGKDDYTGARDTEETINKVAWIGYKQHFFSSVLLTDTPFKNATLKSENLVHNEDVDTLYSKAFAVKLPLSVKGGELNTNMNWYYGPTDYKVLRTYERNLDRLVPFGWGIFGWINRYIFMPLFGFLSSFLPYGIAIILMTILVRLLMSPVTYKSYLSQAKMKVIKPEIAEISSKYKDNAMKKQQETMALYSKAGVSPMAGCLPALMQLPVFYALFQFFPSAFDLRQKSFLWADDLSSYDAIAKLPFKIPFYGDHISLFPILASVAIFFYMRMTTGQQVASQPTQEGMPDMGKMMKYMIYFSPLMMLFFFNNYASGLSLYYFVSNLITIGIMLVIKKYIIDEDKIHAKIQANKKKPKKESRFQRKMKEMMEQAEKQKQAQKRK